MATPPRTDDAIMEAIRAFHDAGSISGGAKQLGMDRIKFRRHLDDAAERGLIQPRIAEPNETHRRPFAELVAARKAEYLRRRVKGTWRKPYLVSMGPQRPFLLTILGDPHLDNPGTDLALWERWAAALDRTQDSYGVCIGDWLDNWLRVLGWLYGESTTTQEEAWSLFEGYAQQMAPHLLGSVGGNHDAWEGGDALIEKTFREHGVRHRPHGLRLALMFEGREEPIFVGLRHKFRGQSQWNPVHAISKAAQLGYRDHVLAAGHIHQSGDARVVCPDTGRITFCAQIGAFKLLDSYADREGFINRHHSPAVSLLIDPRRDDDDPELVHPYYCPEAAASALRAIREAA